jgi:ribonuclease HI
MKKLEKIPDKIPPNFCLRVKCNTLREAVFKKMVHVRFEGLQMNFAMLPDETLGRLKGRVAEWMATNGQGPDWTIEVGDDDPIDFEREYRATLQIKTAPVKIFLKQKLLEVQPTLPWTTLSDQLVQKWKMVRGAALRIYPVDGRITDQDNDDHSYNFEWNEGRQYWFDFVYDPLRDTDGHAKVIQLTDQWGRIDKLIVKKNAANDHIAKLWARILDIPAGVTIRLDTRNQFDYHWAFQRYSERIPCRFITTFDQANLSIIDGSHTFNAEQISRILDLKCPPIPQCHISREDGGPVIIEYREEVQRLGLKILNEHTFSWNIEGRTISDQNVTMWWMPYDFGAIMALGHAIDDSIPEDTNQAIFPDFPWPERVVIRIKPQAPLQAPPAPLPADGASASPAPGLPEGWRGAALGQAQPISTDASGLVGYSSPNQGQGTQQGDEAPPDPALLAFRAEDTVKKNEEIHKLISWTTRKSYPLVVGIGLPVKYHVGDEFHEVQFWEEMEEDLVTEQDTQAAETYRWLLDRLASRSNVNQPPEGVPFSVNEVSVQTWKDGRYGYIMFTPNNSLALPPSTLENQVVIEFWGGYARLGMGNAYTVKMLADELSKATQGAWGVFPLKGIRRLVDGTIVHPTTADHDQFWAEAEDQQIREHPAKVTEDRGRGTLITNLADKGRLLQYWAHGLHRSFVADHVENGAFVNQHVIQCKGGESPDQQAHLVSAAFSSPMKISEWVNEKDGLVHLQCSRLGFVTIRFTCKGQTIDSWAQTKATTKQKEKLASILFDQRVTLRRLSVDDQGVNIHEMVPFAQRYIKPKKDEVRTRQLTFPGAPPPERRSRPPVEMRKRYGGDDYRQTKIVTDVISGKKLTLTYDPTQRITQIDPDVEAEITGADRTVPGDTFVRSVTWIWPDGTTTLITKFNLPVAATPQDVMWRLCRILKIPELTYQFAAISPENWRYLREIKIEFVYERPELSTLRDVSEHIFRMDFDWTCPTFIETDGACAGNEGKQSPGRWGAVIVNGPRKLMRWGAKADTSNNEMEYKAMLEALEFVPIPSDPNLKPLVVMETDSQGCIDGLTKYRQRWEARRWKLDGGKPVENADLIQTIGRRIYKMHVGFWKIKGHSDDPWNDLADALAVKGRNQSKSEIIVHALFRPTVDGVEKVWSVERLSLNQNANIYDFWPYLVDKFGRHGEPEDYEIWDDQKPLSGPLVPGLAYEIVPRSSPGRQTDRKKRFSRFHR